jgi:glycosyltransferase involved in cell wall biosynthesis
LIVFAHLLNDRSGSPRVLKNSVDAVAAMKPAMLYVGSQGDGVLSNCGIPIKKYWYWRTGNKLGTLVTYIFSQLVLFFKLLFDRDIDRNALIYVNTLLPFGAAVYGQLTGRKVIYHVHEISITPAALKWMLVGICRLTSQLNIYVSNAHIHAMPIAGVPSRCIYNSLDTNFASRADESVYRHRRDGVFNVLMIASLRDYKGVPEFISLALRFADRADLHFDLVVNDDDNAINNYFSGKLKPNNLQVHARVADTSSFYCNASLVLNLSRPDQWVETFGVTILDAMAFGIPVIVPPVGGPVELVDDGQQGFLIDCRESEKLAEKVSQLADDEALCMLLSAAARSKAAQFSSEAFAQSIRDALDIKTT